MPMEADELPLIGAVADWPQTIRSRMMRFGEGNLVLTAVAPPTILPCRFALDTVLARSPAAEGERFLSELDRFCTLDGAGKSPGSFPVAIVNDGALPTFAMVSPTAPGAFTRFCQTTFRDTGFLIDLRHFRWDQAKRMLAAIARTSLESDVVAVVHRSMIIDAVSHLTSRGYPGAVLSGKRYMVDSLSGDRLIATVNSKPPARPLLQSIIEKLAYVATRATPISNEYDPNILSSESGRTRKQMFPTVPPWSGALGARAAMFEAMNVGELPSVLTDGFDVESKGAWCTGERGALSMRLHTGGGVVLLCLSGRIADTNNPSMNLRFKLRGVLSGHSEKLSFTVPTSRPAFRVMLPVRVCQNDVVDIEILADHVRRPQPEDVDVRPLSFRLETVEVWPATFGALEPQSVALPENDARAGEDVAEVDPAGEASTLIVIESSSIAAVALCGEAMPGLTLATHEGVFAFDRFQTREGVFVPQAQPFAPLSPALKKVAGIDWKRQALLMPHGVAVAPPTIFERVATQNYQLQSGAMLQLTFIGFNEPETEGAWTAKETAYLLVSQLPGETRGAEVQFDIVTQPETLFMKAGVDGRSGRAPQIEVAADGRCIVGPIVMDGPSMTTPVVVAIDEHTPSAIVRISSTVTSPADVGLSADERRLGMFLTHLRVRPASDRSENGREKAALQ